MIKPHAFEGVVTLVLNRSKERPDAIALVEAQTPLTFGALAARMQRVASAARARRLPPEGRVLLHLHRSIDLATAFLGVLASGGVPVLCEPDAPVEQLRRIVAASQPEFILTKRSNGWCLPGPSREYVEDWLPDDVVESGEPALERADRAAYLVFTSGSTGIPNGVVATQGGLVNRLQWMAREYPYGGHEVACLKTSTGFVDAVAELLGPLAAGIPAIVCPDDIVHDSYRFLSWIEQHRITRLIVVPSLLRELLRDESKAAASLRHIEVLVSSGEPLPVPLAVAVARVLPSATLLNLYGSSEVAADVCCAEITPEVIRDVGNRVPIGKPIASTDVYLVAPDGTLARDGETGELCVAGAGLARGYLNRPSLSAQRFVADAYSGRRGERLYRTGDLARRLPDGQVECLGRIDHQIKLRGQRIELGHIESILGEHPSVECVAAALREIGSEPHIVAYLVPKAGAAIVAADLRSYARDLLPPVMVPSFFVQLERLPLSGNGKVDRLRLPLPSPVLRGDSHPADHATAPVAVAIQRIWSEVLPAGEIGVDDDFFDLGGHSLIAMQIVSRIKDALGVAVTLRQLFANPTVSRLAELVSAHASADASRPPRAANQVEGGDPLSSAQEGVWFVTMLEGETGRFNLAEAIHLRGTLDVTALTRSLSTVLARHGSLRTRFAERGGEPFQIVDRPRELSLEAEDAHIDPAASSKGVRVVMRAEQQVLFDLANGPLIRFRLLRLDSAHHVLIRTCHHIVSDGWSQQIFRRELFSLYDAYVQGRQDPLPLPAVQYSDYSKWEREQLKSRKAELGLAYWTKQLEGLQARAALPVSGMVVPDGHPRFAEREFALPIATVAALKGLAVKAGATLYMVLLAVLGELIRRATGQDDIAVLSLSANRQGVRFEDLIGLFVNTVIIRLRPSRAMTWAEHIGAVRRTTLEAFRHQHVPYHRVAGALPRYRESLSGPGLRVLFSMQNTPQSALGAIGLDVAITRGDPSPQYDLEIYVREMHDTVRVSWVHDLAAIGARDVDALAAEYALLVDSAIEETREPALDGRFS